MNNSPYLDQPLVPFAIALPRTPARIEAELATARPERKAPARNASPVDPRSARAAAVT
jgi:hypothetical protein